MSRTLSQLVVDIETILECEHGQVAVREKFYEFMICVELDRSVLDESIFDEEQLSHIVNSLTPHPTKTEVEVNE